MISIFTEGEGDWIKSSLPFKIFSTLPNGIKVLSTKYSEHMKYWLGKFNIQSIQLFQIQQLRLYYLRYCANRNSKFAFPPLLFLQISQVCKAKQSSSKFLVKN